MRVATQVALALLAAAAGVVSGVCAVAFYLEPWGWWLSVTGLTAAVFVLTGWSRTTFGAGWLAVLGLAVLGRPEGDWAIGTGVPGYGLLAVALLHLGFVAATLPVRRTVPSGPTT
jgi:hypothetical protein